MCSGAPSFVRRKRFFFCFLYLLAFREERRFDMMLPTVSVFPQKHLWRCRVFLGMTWLVGLLCGVFLGAQWKCSTSLMMRSWLTSPVSIVCIFSILSLPFVLSFLAVLWNIRWTIYVIAFAKATVYAFVSYGIFEVFLSAGWLIYPLLMFHEVISLPLLCWLWVRCLENATFPSGWEVTFLIAFLMLVGSLDVRIIAPYLALLIS